jgi:hypothetical protein
MPISVGSRVLRIDGGDFRALTVITAAGCYIVASHPQGGECGAPAACFLAVPDNWPTPPAAYYGEASALEASYSGPIPSGMMVVADALDAALPALARKLDAAEAWLAWVRNHLHPLSPLRFEPHLLTAEAAREAALRRWLAALDAPSPALAAE